MCWSQRPCGHTNKENCFRYSFDLYCKIVGVWKFTKISCQKFRKNDLIYAQVLAWGLVHFYEFTHETMYLYPWIQEISFHERMSKNKAATLREFECLHVSGYFQVDAPAVTDALPTGIDSHWRSLSESESCCDVLLSECQEQASLPTSGWVETCQWSQSGPGSSSCRRVHQNRSFVTLLILSCQWNE